MEKYDKIKYLDFVFERIENVDMFDIYNILSKHKDLERDDLQRSEWNVRQFALTYDLIEKNGTGSYFKLTPKGNELKDFKKGFRKFLKKENKKPWYNENWIGYALAFMVFSFTVYQHFEKKSLTNQVFSLKKERDSLRTQEALHKSSLYDLNLKLEKQKVLKK